MASYPFVASSFDSVRFYAICADCTKKVEVLGWGDPPREEQVWIV